MSEAEVPELLCGLASTSTPLQAEVGNEFWTIQSRQRAELAAIGTAVNGCEIKADSGDPGRSQRGFECRGSIRWDRRP